MDAGGGAESVAVVVKIGAGCCWSLDRRSGFCDLFSMEEWGLSFTILLCSPISDQMHSCLRHRRLRHSLSVHDQLMYNFQAGEVSRISKELSIALWGNLNRNCSHSLLSRLGQDTKGRKKEERAGQDKKHFYRPPPRETAEDHDRLKRSHHALRCCQR